MAAWGVLVLLAVFPVVVSILDVVRDGSVGVPADHEGTFATVTGTTWTDAQAPTAGTARYVTLLERGYALHELTFGLPFLVVVVIPLRRKARWAWWACWVFMISAVGYVATFGAEDPAIFWRALAVTVMTPIALLAFAPHLFGHRPSPSSQADAGWRSTRPPGSSPRRWPRSAASRDRNPGNAKKTQRGGAAIPAHSHRRQLSPHSRRAPAGHRPCTRSAGHTGHSHPSRD
jgi:hypothetical protein